MPAERSNVFDRETFFPLSRKEKWQFRVLNQPAGKATIGLRTSNAQSSIGRVMAEGLQSSLGQPVIVENIPGPRAASVRGRFARFEAGVGQLFWTARHRGADVGRPVLTLDADALRQPSWRPRHSAASSHPCGCRCCSVREGSFDLPSMSGRSASG
jgi:hypothetical protein